MARFSYRELGCLIPSGDKLGFMQKDGLNFYTHQQKLF